MALRTRVGALGASRAILSCRSGPFGPGWVSGDDWVADLVHADSLTTTEAVDGGVTRGAVVDAEAACVAALTLVLYSMACRMRAVTSLLFAPAPVLLAFMRSLYEAILCSAVQCCTNQIVDLHRSWQGQICSIDNLD